MLIDCYEKFRNQVGTLQIKTVKQMWGVISKELSEQLEMNISPNHCKNRWRVVERNYKKFVDNQNSTGRDKKYFEYEEEMNRLFAKKKILIQKYY